MESADEAEAEYLDLAEAERIGTDEAFAEIDSHLGRLEARWRAAEDQKESSDVGEYELRLEALRKQDKYLRRSTSTRLQASRVRESKLQRKLATAEVHDDSYLSELAALERYATERERQLETEIEASNSRREVLHAELESVETGAAESGSALRESSTRAHVLQVRVQQLTGRVFGAEARMSALLGTVAAAEQRHLAKEELVRRAKEGTEDLQRRLKHQRQEREDAAERLCELEQRCVELEALEEDAGPAERVAAELLAERERGLMVGKLELEEQRRDRVRGCLEEVEALNASVLARLADANCVVAELEEDGGSELSSFLNGGGAHLLVASDPVQLEVDQELQIVPLGAGACRTVELEDVGDIYRSQDMPGYLDVEIRGNTPGWLHLKTGNEAAVRVAAAFSICSRALPGEILELSDTE